ncbi:MAG: UDP-N-acetylglucosamine 2-epimerase (non-hydrolyzing) [Candidatus Saccharicenans sp.]|nr:UDP-N-acetylglucosamine 2-epimerase (non-hydrolyzing) [Candidatus Saccharicenans sp.]MDI6849160.1 UDP-N-acetylglucosamine 2-epimerase (non-hydrolyzing) [Candidatus Saccharicenans sp.]
MDKRSSARKKKVLVIMGTRPEVIKLAPVVEALNRPEKAWSRKTESARKTGGRFRTIICLTGQHREMVEPFLKIFGLKPDYDLRVMVPNQHLGELTGRVLAGMKKVLEAEKPDWLLVQGDTTSAMAAALAAFYQKIKIGHVEAGLRTDDKYNPFPEEINRRLISHLTDFHFAPTELARQNLLAEGVRPENIFVTGNTVVDALKMILKKSGREDKKIKENRAAGREKIIRITEIGATEQERGEPAGRSADRSTGQKNSGFSGGKSGASERGDFVSGSGLNRAEETLSFDRVKKIKKLILVTAHRRESFGQGLEGICRAILEIVGRIKEAEVIFPVHLNPAVRKTVLSRLKGQERIHLVEPLDYVTFVHLMRRASLILTDSGGIQEEAPSLGVPVVVMRETTERPEAIQAGVAWLAGTDPEKITRLAVRLLKKVEDREFRRGLSRRNPFGDGRAGLRISRLLKPGDT